MRIPKDISKVMKIYNKNVSKLDKTRKTEQKKDEIVLSKQAKNYNYAMKVVSKLPDIRQEKVKELEGKYWSGTYEVSGNEVADKLINKFFDRKV